MTVALDPAAPDGYPNFRRRLLSMVYEAFLLLGVLFFAGLAFDTYTDSRNALHLRVFRQAWLFVILGLYFVWFWRRGGQTLAMKTWRIRLVRRDGGALTWPQAVWRYCLIWMWVLPALFLNYWMGWQGWPALLAIAIGIVIWGALVRLDPRRQFVHDRLAGTMLTSVPHKVIKQR